MTRSEIFKILKKYKKENSEKYGIHSLGLFGSFSKDRGAEDSDVDVVVEIATPDIFILVHIKDDLERLLRKNVDIIRTREKMNPYLKKRIEKDAVYV